VIYARLFPRSDRSFLGVRRGLAGLQPTAEHGRPQIAFASKAPLYLLVSFSFCITSSILKLAAFCRCG
jgi:hypothetical protein